MGVYGHLGALIYYLYTLSRPLADTSELQDGQGSILKGPVVVTLRANR